MPRFLVEVPHDADKVACARVVEIFLRTGSHFLTHADWGSLDGEHKAWFIAEVASKEEAHFIVPPALRSQAKIVQLSYFTMEDVDAILGRHEVLHQVQRWRPRVEEGGGIDGISQ